MPAFARVASRPLRDRLDRSETRRHPRFEVLDRHQLALNRGRAELGTGELLDGLADVRVGIRASPRLLRHVAPYLRMWAVDMRILTDTLRLCNAQKGTQSNEG